SRAALSKQFKGGANILFPELVILFFMNPFTAYDSYRRTVFRHEIYRKFTKPVFKHGAVASADNSDGGSGISRKRFQQLYEFRTGTGLAGMSRERHERTIVVEEYMT